METSIFSLRKNETSIFQILETLRNSQPQVTSDLQFDQTLHSNCLITSNRPYKRGNIHNMEIQGPV